MDGPGADPEILERGGAWTLKADFKSYEAAIKNALKWRKLDISTFISKKKLKSLI